MSSTLPEIVTPFSKPERHFRRTRKVAEILEDDITPPEPELVMAAPDPE